MLGIYIQLLIDELMAFLLIPYHSPYLMKTILSLIESGQNLYNKPMLIIAASTGTIISLSINYYIGYFIQKYIKYNFYENQYLKYLIRYNQLFFCFMIYPLSGKIFALGFGLMKFNFIKYIYSLFFMVILENFVELYF